MKISRLTLAAIYLLGSLVVACSDDESPPKPGSTPTQTPGSSGGASTFALACDGSATRISSTAIVQPTELEIRCVGGEPGTFCGADPCEPDDAKIDYTPLSGPPLRCAATQVFVWNGTECTGYFTLDESGTARCTGAACEALEKTLAACQQRHATCGG